MRVSHQRRLALGCGRMRSSVSVPSGLTTAPLLSDSSRTGAPRIVTAVADEARVPRWRDRRRAAVVRSSSTRASGSRGAAARGRAGLRPIRARTPWPPAVGRFPWRRVAGVVVADMTSVRHALGIGGPGPRAARDGFSQQGRCPSPPAAPSRADTSGPRNRVAGDAASGVETPTGAGAEPCADGAIC